jgi:alpha-D-ribose 1-methylphosphonate 5-triphosphate synthase subunit PhnH
VGCECQSRGCTFASGTWLELEGPGIQSKTSLWVDGIPHEFWTLRAEKCSYPLGWDIFLVSGNRVIGLPRTTRLEVK